MIPCTPKFIGYVATAALLLLLGGLFLSRSSEETVTAELGQSEQIDVREDGTDFTGFAVFPTWSTLEPASFPLLVDGQAQASWFLEEEFPVEVRTPAGIVLGRGVAYAQAQPNEDGIQPFYADVQAVATAPPYNGPATLLLLQASADESLERAQFTTQIFVETASR